MLCKKNLKNEGINFVPSNTSSNHTVAMLLEKHSRNVPKLGLKSAPVSKVERFRLKYSGMKSLGRLPRFHQSLQAAGQRKPLGSRRWLPHCHQIPLTPFAHAVSSHSHTHKDYCHSTVLEPSERLQHSQSEKYILP